MENPASIPEKTVYVIVGPTAVGKTAAAIELASQLGTEIISADSRQCYREMNIGVARPSLEELAQVKHHFIASHSITDEVNTAVFEAYALNALANIFKEHNAAVVVGGTGLYIKALCEGIDYLPAIDPQVRSFVTDSFAAKGIAWLQEQVRLKDPVFFAGPEYQNPHRLMRALEVFLQTGMSIRSFQTGTITQRNFRIQKIGMEIPRQDLYNRINLRVESMMNAGLLAEAESCYQDYVLNSGDAKIPHALNTVGYSELFDYFNGLQTLSVAVERIKQHTRNYAKRQLTWFHKDPQIDWSSTRRVPPAG